MEPAQAALPASRSLSLRSDTSSQAEGLRGTLCSLAPLLGHTLQDAPCAPTQARPFCSQAILRVSGRPWGLVLGAPTDRAAPRPNPHSVYGLGEGKANQCHLCGKSQDTTDSQRPYFTRTAPGKTATQAGTL